MTLGRRRRTHGGPPDATATFLRFGTLRLQARSELVSAQVVSRGWEAEAGRLEKALADEKARHAALASSEEVDRGTRLEQAQAYAASVAEQKLMGEWREAF